MLYNWTLIRAYLFCILCVSISIGAVKKKLLVSYRASVASHIGCSDTATSIRCIIHIKMCLHCLRLCQLKMSLVENHEKQQQQIAISS